MSSKKRVLKGSAQVAIGEAVGYAASFVRNMILARLLTKADFGIAATFAMMITLLEFSSKLGVSRFVVRDKEGDQPEFIGAAHMVQSIAAMMSSVIMLAASWPMALVFGLPDQKGAMATLALIPLILGFTHLDIRRYERSLNFAPSTYVEMISQLVVTALSWPIAKYFGDYRAVLAILILKAILSCGSTHYFATQPYRWTVHREYATRMLRFGWPLIINGFLMFCLVRGDQFVVASFFNMSDLGAYAAAAALTTAPTLFFSRVFASVVLPVLAKAQDDPAAFERRFAVVIAVICTFSAAYSAGVITAAEALMHLVYGNKYSGTGILLAWLTASNTFRNVRLAAAVAAMAKGDSKNEMLSNLAGGVALALAFAIAYFRQPLWCVACAGLIGECLACSLAFRRLANRDRIPLSRCFIPAGLVMGMTLAAGIIAYSGSFRLQPVLGMFTGLAAAVAAAAFVGFLLPASRHEFLQLWSRYRTVGLRQLLARKARTPAPGGAQ